MSDPEPPAGLAADVATVWLELVAEGLPAGPQLEAYAGQVARMRDAQNRIAEEGAVVQDARGNPIPHPALAIERAAQAEVRLWSDKLRLPRRR